MQMAFLFSMGLSRPPPWRSLRNWLCPTVSHSRTTDMSFFWPQRSLVKKLYCPRSQISRGTAGSASFAWWALIKQCVLPRGPMHATRSRMLCLFQLAGGSDGCLFSPDKSSLFGLLVYVLPRRAAIGLLVFVLWQSCGIVLIFILMQWWFLPLSLTHSRTPWPIDTDAHTHPRQLEQRPFFPFSAAISWWIKV